MDMFANGVCKRKHQQQCEVSQMQQRKKNLEN
jgi:hypothetical protein